MRYNRKRHKTLKILTPKFIQTRTDRGLGGDFHIGTDFSVLREKLNCSQEECEIIFASLFTNEEVQFTDYKVDGLALTKTGFSAFSDFKYIKQNENLIKEWARTFVQILIPILALVIAVLTLLLKTNSQKTLETKETQAIENKLLLIQGSINKLERNTKNLQTEILLLSKTNKDSLPKN